MEAPSLTDVPLRDGNHGMAQAPALHHRVTA